MTLDRFGDAIWIVGSLILVSSALVARRLPRRHMATMALGWIAIFAFLFLLAHVLDR